jgi:hypothetical protein
VLTGAGVLGGGDVSTTTEDGRGTTAPGSDAAPSVIRPGADEPSTQRAPVAPESSSGTDRFAPGERERHVERTASLTLAAPEERLDRVADGVVAVTDRHRGHVVSSSTVSGEDQPAGGSFDLRVPTGELTATLSDLAVLGTVRSQAQTGDDLTQPVASASDRLDAARAERRGLLRRLERADTDREASALRRQYELVAGEIRGLRRQLAALRQRTDYARVSVTLTDESSTLGAGAGSTTGAALDDALGSLVAAFNLAIRALGVLIPLVLVAGLTWLAVSTVQRRRREAVLG